MTGHSRRVGVRELRQNLSVYLRRVLRGETLEVTDHGRPVAVLAPLEPGDALERMMSSGRATRPVGALADLSRPAGRVSRRLGDALRESREERL